MRVCSQSGIKELIALNNSYPLNKSLGRIRHASGIVNWLLHDMIEQLIIIISIKWRLQGRNHRLDNTRT